MPCMGGLPQPPRGAKNGDFRISRDLPDFDCPRYGRTPGLRRGARPFMCVIEMARYSSYSNNAPITHWNNFPIYLTTILTALFAAGFLLSAIAITTHSPALGWFGSSIPLVPSWSLWRLFTYVFIGELGFFTPFAIVCFYWWSVGIETHLGRAALAQLLLLLTLLGPAVGALWYWGFGVPSVSFGSNSFTAGLLIAFATLYPNAESWFSIPFKWIAMACVACGSVMLLGQPLELSQLLASCALGFAYMSYAKEMEHDDAVPLLDRVRKWFERKPKFRVVPSPSYRPRQSVVENETSELDALLDKIARNGIDNLTKQERAKLERLREAMIKKDQR